MQDVNFVKQIKSPEVRMVRNSSRLAMRPMGSLSPPKKQKTNSTTFEDEFHTPRKYMGSHKGFSNNVDEVLDEGMFTEEEVDSDAY